MTELEMIVGARKIGEALGLSSRRIYELADRGELPTVKLGGSLAVRKAKLLEFLESLEAATGASA
ncbi:helix-turn-helix domain-containing protein [Agrobacterium fabrum]|uniref:helix-turn-helix domain-containing protein n=1 Tax=Agrobacterium fabrum TaxID=1176649 RepID=UPI001571C267|nr:helix-turn-helix domain-containing protein [Agrobacterium fabrum]WIE26427.1 helix-turn-helix domain-containing protein [Agrobacterium fabrum]WIE42384.1 helix-turn-helix domain-containing protein [Agrobacterium fabrum]